MPNELYENKTSILMKNILKNIQNIDIYNSLFLLEEEKIMMMKKEGVSKILKMKKRK